MALNNWEYLYNGLTFGGATKYGIVAVEGLASPPDIRDDVGTIPGRHGGWSFLDRYATRVVTITGDLNDNATFETSLDALKKAFVAQTAPLPLSFKRPGMAGSGTMRVNCKPTKMHLPIDFNYQLGYSTWVVELLCDDPFIYDDVATVTTITGATGGTAVINNIGNVPSFPDNIRLTGPFTAPIWRIDADAVNILTMSGSFAGSLYEDIDMDLRTIIPSYGGSNYASVVQASSLWWPLPVGSTTVRFTCTGGSGATKADITWRSAWV